jgi:hypothetical protein
VIITVVSFIASCRRRYSEPSELRVTGSSAPSDSHALLLTARQLRRQTRQHITRKGNEIDELFDARGDLLRAPAQQPRCDTDVLCDREMREQADPLKNIADAPSQLVPGHAAHRIACDSHFARVDIDETIDRLQQRRFSGARSADDCDERASLDAQARVAQGKSLSAPPGLARAFDGDDRLTHDVPMLSSGAFMNDEPGEKTRALLRDLITSFEMLEIFLLMRADPDLSWTVQSVASRVHVSDDIVARALQALHVSQLIELITDPGANPSAQRAQYRYGPGTPALVEAADELARDYSERRAAVLSTMSTNAIERLRSGALSAFADAFILGSKRKDG